MNQINRLLTGLFIIVSFSFANGQMERYDYKRDLQEISSTWHKIKLPDDIYGKLNQSLFDIRVMGITSEGDTIEAPYIFQSKESVIAQKAIAFNDLNNSYNENGYYFTFEVPYSETINQISLNFDEENFDWLIKLEGSQNQNEWFTILNNYRILSIRNETTDFSFTRLTFPDTRYRFFRLLIGCKEDPKFVSANILQVVEEKGAIKNYPVNKVDVKENKPTRQTEIEVDLASPTRVSNISVSITNPIDYYRPVTIQYLADSFETDLGWKYNFKNLTSGVLNSENKGIFTFESTTLQKLRILILNYDNQPLDIGAIEVNGYENELIARFTEKAAYYLVYGNNFETKPNYDIARFADNIPESPTQLILGNELPIEKESEQPVSPLFQNENLLWIIMILIIATLGWFSLKMIRKS